MKFYSAIIVLVCTLLLSFGALASPGLAGKIPAGSSVYVEPFAADKFSLHGRLENEIIHAGYRLVSRPESANFIVRWSYSHGAFTYATVRIVNQNDEIIHVGESKNPGFGTIVNKNGATWGCIRRALHAD